MFASGAVALCLLILLLLPAGAFAESVTFDYDVDNKDDEQLKWDGNQLILDVYPGRMPDKIIFDLKGNSGKTVTVRLMGDVEFPYIKVQNQSAS